MNFLEQVTKSKLLNCVNQHDKQNVTALVMLCHFFVCLSYFCTFFKALVMVGCCCYSSIYEECCCSFLYFIALQTSPCKVGWCVLNVKLNLRYCSPWHVDGYNTFGKQQCLWFLSFLLHPFLGQTRSALVM